MEKSFSLIFFPLSLVLFSYVWLSKNLRERKYKGKVQEEKKYGKMQNKLKVHKLFLFSTSKLVLLILTHRYKY